MSKTNYTLFFNSQDQPLKLQFKKYNEISLNIIQQIIQPGRKYDVQSKVKDEIFAIFLKYLNDGTQPEIYFDNIYDFQQLADEFQILELQQRIKDKFQRYRDMEKALEQQALTSQNGNNNTPNSSQEINQIYTVLTQQQQRIDQLEQKVQSLEIDYNSQIQQQGAQIKNDYETYVDQQVNNLKNDIQTQLDDINLKIQRIENDLSAKDSQFQSQATINQDYESRINRLQNQVDQISTNDIIKQKNDLNNLERNINVSIEQIKQAFLTKQILNFF